MSYKVPTILLESYLVQTWLDFRKGESSHPEGSTVEYSSKWLKELGKSMILGRQFFEKDHMSGNELALKMARVFADEKLVKFLLTRWPNLSPRQIWRVIDENDMFCGLESLLRGFELTEFIIWTTRLYEYPVQRVAIKCLPALCLTLLSSYLTQIETIGSINVTFELLGRLLKYHLHVIQQQDEPCFISKRDLNANFFPVLKIIEDRVFPAWRKKLFEDKTGVKRDSEGVETEKQKLRREISSSFETLSHSLGLVSELAFSYTESVSRLQNILAQWMDQTIDNQIPKEESILTSDQIRSLSLGSKWRNLSSSVAEPPSIETLEGLFSTKKEMIYKNNKIDKAMLHYCLKLRDRISAISDVPAQASLEAQLTSITNQISYPLHCHSNHRHLVALLELSAYHPWLVTHHLLVSASQQPNLAEAYIKFLALLDISRCKRYRRAVEVDLEFQPTRPIILDAIACALVRTPSSSAYVNMGHMWCDVISRLMASDKPLCYPELLPEVFFPILRSLTIASQPLAHMIYSIIAKLKTPQVRIPIVSLVTCRFFSTICLIAQHICPFGEELTSNAIAAIMPLGYTVLKDATDNELSLVKSQYFMDLVNTLKATLEPHAMAYEVIAPFVQLYESII
ncbi:hypothetical protein DSO57_1001228 [Entomophthora muscae]|uniref:Uncharacterized protein n=1 Tax=Entomophthora muscae TaxID=34485 RepID=A0ACC2SLQ9_9FUNG|nr:hypothetical protein DSO57_1001228 [Entomophthora muscae]